MTTNYDFFMLKIARKSRINTATAKPFLNNSEDMNKVFLVPYTSLAIE